MTDSNSSAAEVTHPTGATLTVKLVKSVAGTRESHRATVRGLGLRKTGSVSTLEDTPSVRGMIDKVSYLVQVL
jgi:large subunit ribosomal protein L30